MKNLNNLNRYRDIATSTRLYGFAGDHETGMFRIPGDDGEWLFNLAVYAHGDDTSCFITETAPSFEGMNRGAATRMMADRIDDLSFLMRQFAEKYDETERGEALVVVTIFTGGHVRLRTNCDKVTTDEQREWVRDMLELAKSDKNISGDAA